MKEIESLIHRCCGVPLPRNDWFGVTETRQGGHPERTIRRSNSRYVS